MTADESKPPDSPSPAPPNDKRIPHPAKPKSTPSWSKKDELDSIHIEIESASPAVNAKAPAQGKPTASAESGQESEDARAANGNTDRKRVPWQPAVYKLDMGEAKNIRDEEGRIDWSRAVGKQRHDAAPAKPGKKDEGADKTEKVDLPAGEAAAPFTPAASSDEIASWEQMPGAEKVLRKGTTPHRSHKPHAPHTPRGSKRATKPHKPGEPAPHEGQAPPGSPGSPYARFKGKAAMIIDPQALQTADEFSDILFHVNRALLLVQGFRAKYPFLIAPNVFGVWEDNLKETATTMLREFQQMKDPKAKQYDKRYVCKSCKSVFFISLPDGVCDECRGKSGTGSLAPY